VLAAASCADGAAVPSKAPEPAPRDGAPLEAAARPPLVVTRGTMGTRFQIALVGDDDEALARIARSCLDEVDRLECIFSSWAPDTEVSRLTADAAAGWRDASPELAAALAAALELSERTGGAFDVTVGPALRAWGFYSGGRDAPPSAEELASLAARVGAAKVRVRAAPPAVYRDAPGVELDFGALAKGFAIDAVVERLRAAGVENAFVNAGGSTVYALGDGPDGIGWPLEVETAAGPRTWRLVDEAVSTSGRMGEGLRAGGERLGHILDPRTLAPAATDVARATFRGPSATEADAASTALVALGSEHARAWFERDAALAGRSALLVLESGRDVRLER